MTQPGFLHNVHVYVHENVADRHEIAEHVNDCGGTLTFDLNEQGVTHYLVQNDLTSKKLTDIRKYCTQSDKVLASVHWINACMDQGELLDPLNFPPEFDPTYTLPEYGQTAPFNVKSSESNEGSGSTVVSTGESRPKSVDQKISEFNEVLLLKRQGTPISNERRASVLDDTGQLVTRDMLDTSDKPPRSLRRRRSSHSRSQSPNSDSYFDSDITNSISDDNLSDDSEISFRV